MGRQSDLRKADHSGRLFPQHHERDRGVRAARVAAAGVSVKDFGGLSRGGDVNHQQLLENRVLLRPDEVAAVIGKSKETVYRLVRSGGLEAVKSGHLRITSESVRRHIGLVGSPAKN